MGISRRSFIALATVGTGTVILAPLLPTELDTARSEGGYFAGLRIIDVTPDEGATAVEPEEWLMFCHPDAAEELAAMPIPLYREPEPVRVTAQRFEKGAQWKRERARYRFA